MLLLLLLLRTLLTFLLIGVKLWFHGAWNTIVIDDLFPCVRSGRGYVPIGARVSRSANGEKEMWALAAEKAWAKLHGSYQVMRLNGCLCLLNICLCLLNAVQRLLVLAQRLTEAARRALRAAPHPTRCSTSREARCRR